MFSRKRRMPPIARRRKAQLTIPSKFWKPELDKTYQKLDTMYFYGDLWVERENNCDKPPWYEGVPWTVDRLVWLAPPDLTLLQLEKKNASSFFFGPLRFRLFLAELWFYFFGNLGIFCDNVLRSRCRIGSPEPALFFTLSLRMFWMAISESGNQSDIEADVLPRLWHSWLYKGKYWPATHIVFSHFSRKVFL